MTKLNLGCGFNKLNNYTNVDSNSICLPDVQLILDQDKWPWEDSSIEEVLLDHILEHLGETTAQYFHVIKELYRVCKSGAKIIINVPHHRHDNFIHDCTHVRPITPEGLAMFNKEHNLQGIADGGKESKLGLMLNVDFRIISIVYQLEPRWQIQMQNNLISSEEMMNIMKTQNNICYEVGIELAVLKESGQ